jgi:plastocyanin
LLEEVEQPIEAHRRSDRILALSAVALGTDRALRTQRLQLRLSAVTRANGQGGLYFNKTKLSAKSGKVTLVMSNPGSSGLTHGIAVEGNGVDKDGPIVAPGKTSTLTVSLKPGKYEFYCPFDGHKAKGMKGTLTVGSSASKQSGGSSGAASSGSGGGGSGY